MIKFVRSFRSYFPNDIAKFTPAMEEDLVKRGIAEPITPPEPAAAPDTGHQDEGLVKTEKNEKTPAPTGNVNRQTHTDGRPGGKKTK
jgi:hypothetical protein